MTPRDPQRIDRMVELLRQAWHLFPDERLTQVLINAAEAHEGCGSLFYLENDKMEEKLRKLIAGRQKFVEDRRHKG